MGDCVMAFWNAPLDDPDHAVHAIEAALAMANAARRFSDLVAADARIGGEAPMNLAVGIGINTGDAVVGNMGSTARFDYTVLGDAVNLASRLETLCRTYEVPIVIGEATRAIVSERYVTAFLDRVAVKGRSETEAIYTVLGPAEPALTSFASAHDDAVAAIRAGRLTSDDPVVLAAARDLPQLSAFYRTLSVPVPPAAGAAAS
jgi:adenylate cyclase